MPVGEKQTYRFGPFELDTQCGQLRRDGIGLKLQGQPVQILEILLEKTGQLVTREELRERLWASDTFVDFDHSLNTAIKKLRQVLGDEADTPRYVETLPRRGYRFIAEVSAEDSLQKNSGDGPVAVEDFVSKVATTLADAAITAATESRRRSRRTLWVVATSAALMAMAALAYWLTKPPPMPRIVGSHALTHTGYRKEWDERPGLDHRVLTDGQRVFFQENRPSGVVTMQVPRNGGEVSEVHTSPPNIGSLRDISKDGSEILVSVLDTETGTGDAWVHPLTGGSGRLIVRDAYSPTWTADGRAILFARNDDQDPRKGLDTVHNKDLYRVNSDGTDVRRLSKLPEVSFLNTSPDGRRIRFMSGWGSQLWEANTNGSNAHRLFPSQPSMMLPGDWSPDGKYYFYTSWSGDRWDLWALPEPRPSWGRSAHPVQLTSGPMWILSPTLSKDGKQLYALAMERHGELAVYDRKAGKFVQFLAGLPASLVDFSRDGQWIAYVSYPEGNLWRSRVDGTDRRQLTVPPMAVVNPKWSPDGKSIAFVDMANGDRGQMLHSSLQQRLFMISADGGGPMLLVVGGGDPAWSPDSRTIAYGSHLPDGYDLRLLDLASMRSSTIPGSQNMFSPRWSPDGRYLAAMSIGHSRLAIYNFVNQVWADVLKPPGNMNWPCWSRDSKFIFVAVDYVRAGLSHSIVRVGIADQKIEMVASLADVRYTSFFFWDSGWFGLTPDDRPVTTLDKGIAEIYAFDLEYK